MSSPVALVTDSTCNLPHDLAAQHHIYMAPLYVLWGEESYRDGVDITEAELFSRLAVARELPKTSQVSPQDFADLYRRARETENAEEVVCGVISSSISGTYASAMQAREMVDFPVHVVDTRQTSWALGFAMLAAARARDAGQGAEAVAEALRETATRTHLLFIVESLDYLHKGGRIGGASRLLGTALNIKPVLELRDGVVQPVDKVRTRKRATEYILTHIGQVAGGKQMARLSIIHGGVEDEARALRDAAVARYNPGEAYISYATAVLGVHVGPGALGINVEWSA
ncbi:MAG: DegV family protein [Anaerolineae bacterium]|nr:DegV family protein [Anaerolineae bacterium]